jgi:hypothetical protein
VNTENRWGGRLAIAGGLVVMAGCARHVLRALDAGMTTGRQGAAHYAQDPAYLVSVGAGILGFFMGAYLIRMGWRWLRGPAP